MHHIKRIGLKVIHKKTTYDRLETAIINEKGIIKVRYVCKRSTLTLTLDSGATKQCHYKETSKKYFKSS